MDYVRLFNEYFVKTKGKTTNLARVLKVLNLNIPSNEFKDWARENLRLDLTIINDSHLYSLLDYTENPTKVKERKSVTSNDTRTVASQDAETEHHATYRRVRYTRDRVEELHNKTDQLHENQKKTISYIQADSKRKDKQIEELKSLVERLLSKIESIKVENVRLRDAITNVEHHTNYQSNRLDSVRKEVKQIQSPNSPQYIQSQPTVQSSRSFFDIFG